MSFIDVGPLNVLVKSFEDASVVWAGFLAGRALHVFALLSAIEMTWFSISFLLQADSSLDGFLRALLRKFFPMGMALWLIVGGPYYLALLPKTFTELGLETLGWSALQGFQPTAFLHLGINTMSSMGQSLTAWGYFAIGGGFNYVIAILCEGTLVVAFTAMTALIVVTLCETWFCLGFAPFLLAFAGSRWTYSLAESVLTHLVRVSIKLFVLYMYGALIFAFATQGMNGIASGAFLNIVDCLLFAATCAIACILMFSVSRLVGHLVPTHIHWGLNPNVDAR